MLTHVKRPLAQCTIGVLGGMSNQATGEYYRLLNDALNARYGGWDNGEIVVVSVNFGNIEHFIRHDLWTEARTYLAEKVDRIEAAGADVIICVSNTMHRVVEPVMQERSTPFIHIADPTGAAIQRLELTRVALLGTMPVMCSDDLARRYAERFGVEIISPCESDKTIVDRVIFEELVRRDLRPDSKKEYLRIVQALRDKGAQGVILGCTEIFLLLGADDLPGFPVFDTTALHVEATVAFVTATHATRSDHHAADRHASTNASQRR